MADEDRLSFLVMYRDKFATDCQRVFRGFQVRLWPAWTPTASRISRPLNPLRPRFLRLPGAPLTRLEVLSLAL